MTAFDLVLAGGRVVDPSQSLDAVLDIGFTNGKVSEIGQGLADRAAQVRNVRGLVVTPGLIDLHTHVYWGGTSLGIDAEEFCRTSGVTTSVDTGSAGPGNFAGFREHVIDRSPVRILAYLHISHAGIYGFSRDVHVGESETIRLMDPRGAVRVVEAEPRCDRRHQGAGRAPRLGRSGRRAAGGRHGGGGGNRLAAHGPYRRAAAIL